MPPNWKTAAGIVAALALGGCITDERAVSANSNAVGLNASEKSPLDPVDAANVLPTAPAAVFSDLAGKSISLAKLRGKVVFIDFWAPWCAPCRAGLPFTERLNDTFKDKGLVVLGVSGDPEKSVKEFMAANHYKFNAVLDTKNFAEKFGVSGIPHTVVIDRRGRIVAEEEGLAPQAETIKNLAKAGLDVTGFEPLHDPTLDSLIG
ncbi:MAG: peroxiredoxin family protein [Fimbriimonadaceae bacterium]